VCIVLGAVGVVTFEFVGTGTGTVSLTKGPGTVPFKGGVMITIGAGPVLLLTFAGGGVMGRMLFVAFEGKVKTSMLKTI